MTAALHGSLPRTLLVEAARKAVASARDEAENGQPADEHVVIERAQREVERMSGALLSRIVNATGVILHTNLGRAPLSEGAAAAMADVATGYSNLEFDADAGQRGSRDDHAGTLLAMAVGAEAGIVVNNNAAAVLVVLAALARGREVIVSRGELIEIGGSFRVPDVLRESGAILREVGTTNRTRSNDYAAAVNEATALILKVHPSNYRVVGFVESADIASLTGFGPPLVYDVGSGLLDESTPWLSQTPPWLRDEPGVRQALALGADIVTFSGDKLLGGPQAGVIVGRAPMVRRVAKHPLYRALRVDKLTLAALEHVALAYLSGDAAQLPVWLMATADIADLEQRAKALAEVSPRLSVVETTAVFGGGAVPGLEIPSVGVALSPPPSVADLAAAFRARRIVGRVQDDAMVLDLRTVALAEDEHVRAALAAIAGG